MLNLWRRLKQGVVRRWIALTRYWRVRKYLAGGAKLTKPYLWSRGVTVVGTYANLSMGYRVSVNPGVILNCAGKLTIGNHVHISAGAQIHTSTLNLETMPFVEHIQKPVVIGNNVCIFAGAIVVPGVTIADNCVLLPGGVLTKSTEPNGVYGGVPAHRLRNLTCRNEKNIET